MYRLIGRALIFLLIFAGAVGAEGPGHFNIKAGLGYDFISQEYFYDSLRYTETDTALQSALLKKDYLDDKKGFLYLGYGTKPALYNYSRHHLEVGWEQTSDLYRLLGSVDFLLGGSKDKVEGRFRYDLKERIKGQVEPGEELSVINGALDYRRRWADFVESRIRLFAENVSFDSVSSYIYNYSRYGLELGVAFTDRDFNTFSAGSILEIRNVPDSTRLDYLMVRGSLGYFGRLLTGQLSADLSLEYKDFDLPESSDDYLLWSLYTDSRIDFDESFFFKSKLSLEYFDFTTSENINDDYYLVRFGLLPGRQWGNFSLAVGPQTELLGIKTDYNDEDYFEYGLLAELDFFNASGLFFIFENEFGRRAYRNEPDYTSDFIFDRVNLIASLNIYKGLSADILLTTDWEWHEIDSDNSRIYLISAGLSYSL